MANSRILVLKDKLVELEKKIETARSAIGTLDEIQRLVVSFKKSLEQFEASFASLFGEIGGVAIASPNVDVVSKKEERMPWGAHIMEVLRERSMTSTQIYNRLQELGVIKPGDKKQNEQEWNAVRFALTVLKNKHKKIEQEVGSRGTPYRIVDNTK